MHCVDKSNDRTWRSICEQSPPLGLYNAVLVLALVVTSAVGVAFAAFTRYPTRPIKLLAVQLGPGCNITFNSSIFSLSETLPRDGFRQQLAAAIGPKHAGQVDESRGVKLQWWPDSSEVKLSSLEALVSTAGDVHCDCIVLAFDDPRFVLTRTQREIVERTCDIQYLEGGHCTSSHTMHA